MKGMSCLLWAMVVSGAYGAEFCALRVNVSTFYSRPAIGVSVDLQNEGEVVLSRRTDERGEVAFCDFGFTEHSVRVRDAFCNDITLGRISVDPATEKSVKVLLNHCLVNMKSPTSCLCLLRVRTGRDEPIPGAELRTDAGRVLFVSNSHGVFHFGIRVATVLKVEVHAAGFGTVQREFRCQDPDPIKETIVLNKVKLP
jgi:hypothetical protein